MEKLFICLANSKKYTQRCIAGIELVKSPRQGYRYEIVRKDVGPVWIRPVSGSEHGEVASKLVDHISLLDIVAVNVTSACPQGYQSENVLLDDGTPLRIIEKTDLHPSLTNKLSTTNHPKLFGNDLKFVDTEDIGQIDHSLVFIEPNTVHVYESLRSTQKSQIRTNFFYNDTFYSLPITDIDFIEKFRCNPTILQNCTHIYFTVSLGIAFKEKHYKLVAGIVHF